MVDTSERPPKLAVLIDAENASPRIAAGLFAELARVGDASIRRIYGDFSGTRLKTWADLLPTYGISAHQSHACAAGKNAADIALVIDAMDLLHTGRVDGFCLVSSDSDFSRLATRIREQGLDVYGAGERKTPASFRTACKRFFEAEGLVGSPPATVAIVPALLPDLTEAPSGQPPRAATPLIKRAIDQMEERSGWYHLGAVGAQLKALSPGFNPKVYGCPKLMTLIERSAAFDVKRDGLMVSIRLKGGAPSPTMSSDANKPAPLPPRSSPC